MTFDQLTPAVLRRRYKRFLADVELENGDMLTVHCPNTGAMTGCAEAGSPVWLSVSDSPTRKYPHTWELVGTARGMACIHSARANRVVEEAVLEGRVEELAGYDTVDREVKYGAGSRADLRLRDPGRADCLVEIKSVTLCDDNGVGVFPDAVSQRARKHLEELETVAASGSRAVIFFCVFHEGITEVRPAFEIDPAYCEALASACAAGVEPIAWRASISQQAVVLDRPVPVVLER